MRLLRFVQPVGVVALAAAMAFTTGCKDLPGSPEAQGATVGGVSGAAIGAVVAGDDNRLLGALIGGALGAGGGYLIGANKDKILGKDSSSAKDAVERAQTAPATPEQARVSSSADVNNDGFVTMDEVVALEKAGYTDAQIIDRLENTEQVYELTAQQKDTLRSQGVSDNVIRQLPQVNRELRQEVLTSQGGADVISEPQSGRDRSR